jgi:heat shock protein HslJ
MKTTLLLAPLALALSACAYGPGYPPPGPGGPYPAPYPGPPVDQPGYRAIGTEPFWDLTIGRDMVFTDRGNDVGPVVQPTPRPINGFAGEIYQTPRINVNIVHAPCSDGMSDRTYPDKVQVRVDGRAYEGCGGPASFWATAPRS